MPNIDQSTITLNNLPNIDQSSTILINLPKWAQESEDESIYNSQQESNLEARLSRLALLDKTQREINQISVATESMLQQSPGTFYRISSRNLKLPKLDFDNLDSIGSEYESSSDIHTERWERKVHFHESQDLFILFSVAMEAPMICWQMDIKQNQIKYR